jgi:outer membrane protein, multidrug efflux system
MEDEGMRRLTWFCITLSCLLAGCVVGPNYKRPVVSTPTTFHGQATAESDSLADLAWWEAFPDPTLGSLIKEALTANNDLRTAIARVEQARDLVAVARAEYYPLVGYDVGVQRDHGIYKSNLELSLPTRGPSQNLFLGGLSTAWELDVWGRIRRLNQAALAEFLATQNGRRAVMLSLVSDLAQAYFRLQELDRRLTIARNSTSAFQSTFALFSRRYGAGITSRLAVTRAESALAEASGTVSDIERQISITEHEICVLVGRNPGTIDRDPAKDSSAILPAIPAGLPSSLLERRPDLLQGEQELVAASARIGVARADFFPRIGLTALFGRVSPQLASLTSGSAGVAALAGSAAGPIFTGGQLTGQYRVAMSAYEQAKSQYMQGVLKAFQEVSDALISEQKLTELADQQTHQVGALNESVVIANKRYLGGLASYYEVLEAQQLLFPAEIALSRTRRDRLLTFVDLYKALGGGWKLTDTQFIRGHS